VSSRRDRVRRSPSPDPVTMLAAPAAVLVNPGEHRPPSVVLRLPGTDAHMSAESAEALADELRRAAKVLREMPLPTPEPPAWKKPSR